MSNTEKFLSAYKNLEAGLRDFDLSPRDYEDRLGAESTAESSLQCERLRMCRQVRNYLSHVNDPLFIEPTAEMTAFLEALEKQVRLSRDVAKKHLKSESVAVLKHNMTCKQVISMFVDLRCLYMPVLMSDGKYKAVKLHDVLKANAKDKLADVKKCVRGIVFCSPLDLYGELDNSKIVLCTDDGSKTGKVLGRVWFPGDMM